MGGGEEVTFYQFQVCENADAEINSEESDANNLAYSTNNSSHRNALVSKSGYLVLNKQTDGTAVSKKDITQNCAADSVSEQYSEIDNSAYRKENFPKIDAGNNNFVDIPKLNLSDLSSAHQSQISATDSYSEAFQSHLISQNSNNSGASHSNAPLLHFSAHDRGATGRTYEVDSPTDKIQIPYISSSNIFREGGSPEVANQNTYREREQGPEKLTPGHSDLADDLKVPYPFDSQAKELESEREADQTKPPSPPVQTTPPPGKEPVTSLRSSSNVYAVSNPQILKAQGINAAPDVFTPRQYSNNRGKDYIQITDSRSASQSKQEQEQVRFDQSADQHRSEIYGYTPVRDRVPTPFAHSPKEERHLSPGELHLENTNEWDTSHEPPRKQASPKVKGKSLPPQHPPLDTKPPSRDTNLKDDTVSVKRIYVESPSFTKEEEDEYRFVSSRIDDIEDRGQGTYREMEGNIQRGYGGDDNHGSYGKTGGYAQRRERVPGRARDGSDNKRSEINVDMDKKNYEQDRYEDRNRQINGYSKSSDGADNHHIDRYDKENDPSLESYNDNKNERQRRHVESYNPDTKESISEKDGYVRNKYGYNKQTDPFERQERYERLQDDRERYEREKHRYSEEGMKEGYGKQNTEMDLQDLQKEEEYQRNLQRRIDYEKSKDNELVIPQIPFHERQNFENDVKFVRDSLDVPDDRDGQEFARDSLEYNSYAQQGREWGQVSQNLYADYEKESSKPDFYDPEDAARMEIVNPPHPRIDYVEKNKLDYGFMPKKSYRDIVHKKREENEKLDHIFITPKVPPKHSKHTQVKKSQSAQPTYQPPPAQQYPAGFKPSSAEELWAQRSTFLARKASMNGSTDDGKKSKSAGKPTPKAWSNNTRVNQPYTYQSPPPLPSQGQLYRQKNFAPPSGGSQGYTTPTKLQPLENKPQPPMATNLVPAAVEPSSPFKRHLELKPISQEITTEDGQRISVDINLRLISPPPGHGSPRGSQQGHHLALVPVQQTQLEDSSQSRGIGVPYQMHGQFNRDYQRDNDYGDSYQQEALNLQYDTVNDPYANEPLQYTDVSPQQGDLTLVEPSGYELKHKYETEFGYGDEDGASNSDMKSLEEGYAAIYHKMKSKDPAEHPWYKVYDIKDYKKMQREVRLNRGTLGPDLDTEDYKEKLEKRHKQFEYARMVMEKNRLELSSKKPPKFPRDTKEENYKRKVALEYAKNVPKPTVKPRPNQYNSYEVSAQITPGGPPVKRTSPTMRKHSPQPSQTVDVIDIRTLEQRHLAERKNVDKIRHNMDSVLSQKAA